VSGMSQPRALVAYCSDWAVIAAGRLPACEVAVVSAHQVVAASPAARAAGVKAGMRRREAQACCPGLDVLASDVAAEARFWEPAVAAVEAFAPGAEVLQPGQLALGARGPSRYFGGDQALAAKVAATIETVVASQASWASQPSGDSWAGCCRVGVADGLFTAGLAARQASGGEPLVVPKGRSPQFLAPISVRVLALPGLGSPADGVNSGDLAGLADLLVRLGLKTLGDFAALPAPSVLGRFGTEGLLAHRLARGLGERPVRARLPPPDWVVYAELDPPADQLQAAAFVGRALAEELHSRLSGTGLVCTRLAIEVETEYGTTLRRSWRHDGALSAAAIGERVRWQLEGWALTDDVGAGGSLGRGTRTSEAASAGGIIKLTLIPEEVRPDVGRQLGFWGHDAAAGARAARALARVQGLLGPEGALTGVLQGGRDYTEQVLFVPWGEPRAATGAKGEAPPWPGHLPGLAPAVVHHPSLPAQVMDEQGETISVGSRGTASARPAQLVVGKGQPQAISAWAGPWPLEERWWDGGGRRRARFQVCTVDGAAYLLTRERRRWWVEAIYD
jgi:protein ImuB